MGKELAVIDATGYALTSFNAADLQSLRIENIADLTDYTPNLEINTAFAAFTEALAIFIEALAAFIGALAAFITAAAGIVKSASTELKVLSKIWCGRGTRVLDIKNSFEDHHHQLSLFLVMEPEQSTDHHSHHLIF